MGELGDTIILGATDNTEIGNEGDKLKTSSSAIPLEDSVHFLVIADNATHGDDMAQDGSVTPIEYTIEVPSVQIWYLTRFLLQIHDNGSSLAEDFGSISNGLTNGLLLEWEIDSTRYTIANIQKNGDIAFALPPGFQGMGSNFVSNSNFYTGEAVLEPHSTLKGSTSDKFVATVRDDLTSLSQLRMGFRYWRSI